jgi:hypothetical protein
MLREIIDIYNKIKQLNRRIVKQIKYSLSNPIDDPVCCEVLYINGANGNIYYKDDSGNWVLKTNSFDTIVDFSVNVNPNTVGTTFSPNSPELTTVLYVSTIDNSQWTYNGMSYVSYVAPFWTLRGNTGTTPGTDFIGTIDNKDFIIKRNNLQVAKLTASSICYGFGAMGIFNPANTVAIGYVALGNANNSSQANVAIGANSLEGNTSGSFNVGLGHYAGAFNVANSNQIFINSLNRGTYAGDKTQSPIYIQQNSVVANQLIDLNAGVTTLRGGTSAAELRFLEPSAFGTNYTSFKAVPQAVNIDYSLPPTVGAANTVLTDVAGNGVLTWVAPIPAPFTMLFYTPTLFNITNVAASTAYNTQFVQNGDWITVWGEIDIDATTALTISELEMDLPVGTNMVTTYQLAGTASFEDNTSVKISGNVGNGRAKFRFTPQTNTNNKYSFHFSYYHIVP